MPGVSAAHLLFTIHTGALELAHLPPDYSHHEALYRKFRERGGFSLLLAQPGLTVTGVDVSSTAIEWAVERANAVSSNVCLRAQMPTHLDDLITRARKPVKV